MRTFKNKETGAKMLVTNDFTIKQMLKSDRYEEVLPKKAKQQKPATTSSQDDTQTKPNR